MLPGLESQTDFSLGEWRLSYVPRFLHNEQADVLFQHLLGQADWTQPELHIHGKTVLFPRLVAWQGDAGIGYSYSGQTHVCSGWQPQLEELRDRVQAHTGLRFNFALLNLYRDGRDAMGWHSDNEKELGPNPIVASVSLGAERDFLLRARPGEKSRRLKLEHGSLLLMPGAMAHHLPRRSRVDVPRINITFRHVKGNENQNVNH